MDQGCSRHGLIPSDLVGTDSVPCCCSVKQLGYNHCILPRGRMIGRVDIPCGSLTAESNAEAKNLLYYGGVTPENGQVPASQSKSQGISNRVPFLDPAWERQMVPVDHGYTKCHHIPLTCSIPLPLWWCKKVQFPLN